MRLRRLLFPIDFSPGCLGASRYVEDFARRFQAEVTFLHIVSSDDFLRDTTEFGRVAFVENYEAGIRAAWEKINGYLWDEFRHLDVTRLVVEGDPALKIMELARQYRTDLIMMPTHGLGPFRRFVLGSLTAKILHDAECPVWTGVHLENAPPLEKIAFRKILCAVDLGPHSRRALAWASAFAREHDAELIAAHVTPAPESRPDLVQELTTQATAELSGLLGSLELQARIVIEAGEPAKGVQSVAEAENADLAVIARGAISEGWGRLRTHSYSIIRSTPCPVVSI
jgi:nucleotide-binding universal stress UspA family protein